jgi:hypothetical protein
MNYNVDSWTCINFVVMIVKSQIKVFRGCSGHKYHLYSEKYYKKSNLAMSNSKEPHISLRVKKYSSNQSYLLHFLYLLHLYLYLKSMYPWIRITRVQNNEVFCIINIICKCIRISLFSWLHTYSILIHAGVIYEPGGIDPLKSLGYKVYSSLSKFVRTNSLWYLIDFKLQLLFFYVSAFHILMNIFTFRLYRQIEKLYLSLLTVNTWNVKNKIILEEHSIYYSFHKSNI